MLANIISFPTGIGTCYVNRTLPFYETYYLGDCILRRYRDHYVHMIWHKVALLYRALFLFCQPVKYIPQLMSYLTKDRFPAILRDENYVVLTLPAGVI